MVPSGPNMVPEGPHIGPRLAIYVKNSNGHNSPHMARQNFIRPPIGTEFRRGSFWFSPNQPIFRVPGPGPGPGPWARAPILGPYLYIGPQLGPQFIYRAPIWTQIYILGPNLGPNLIRGPRGPIFIYLKASPLPPAPSWRMGFTS